MLSTEQTHFRDRAIALAKRYGPRYKIDWRLMAATAILESGWGQSTLAREANNLFGITATSRTPGHAVYVLEQSDGPRRFRRYPDEDTAFRAYGRLLGRSRIYESARDAARDAAMRAMLRTLAPVYCPGDPDYETKILQIIDMLERWDKEAA